MLPTTIYHSTTRNGFIQLVDVSGYYYLQVYKLVGHHGNADLIREEEFSDTWRAIDAFHDLVRIS